ncbi:MAG: hypothetical protein ABIY55_14900 [Kofleriaceae bacterium]
MSIDVELEYYQDRTASPAMGTYRVEAIHRFSEAERGILTDAFTVNISPYRDYPAFHRAVQAIVRDRVPGFFREAVAAARSHDVTTRPVLYFKNCPIGLVPELDYEDPLTSKYERKKDFVAEVFLSVFAELYGTAIVTYRSANRGDMFHDIHPMKKLAYSITQKTVNTLHFHRDLPNNLVRPDWVYLLALRNSPRNIVYTPIVRLKDIFDKLDAATVEVLRRPIFRAPLAVEGSNISHYGLAGAGYTEPAPLLAEDRGHASFAFHEGCTQAIDDEGMAAIEVLRGILHREKDNLFLQEGDFAAICNNTSMHARHVVKIDDHEAHRHRWLLKTWNVDDLEPHRKHFLKDLVNTSDQ